MKYGRQFPDFNSGARPIDLDSFSSTTACLPCNPVKVINVEVLEQT